jgi:hypothetical protein
MSFGPKDSLPASLQWGAQREDAAVQDTQEVRVVEAGTTDDTLNVVRIEDERIVAGQQRGDDGHNPCSDLLAVAPRSSAFRFTVGRQVDVSAIELMVEIAAATVGAGSFWVALFDGTIDEPTAWRRNFGSFAAGKVGEAEWVNCYLGFSADTVETLYPGSYYWIAICARDPDPGASTPDAEAWQGAALWVRKIVHAGITGRLVIDNSGDAIPPYAPGGYDSYDNLHHPWFKLYERSIIYDVPVAPGASVPSVGETAVMERIQGQHPRRQITGGALRTSSKAGVVRSGVGGAATAGGDPHHQLLSDVHDDTEGAAPTRGDVVTAQGAAPDTVWKALAKSGTASHVLRAGADEPYWGAVDWAEVSGKPSSFTPAAHNLLSAYHGDTAAASPVRGDIMVANSTPAWSKLAKGSQYSVIVMGANDPAWSLTPRLGTRAGVGKDADAGAAFSVQGQHWSAVKNWGDPGGTLACDLDQGNVHTITLSANRNINLSNGDPGGHYVLVFLQSGGSFTPTLKTGAGGTPTLHWIGSAVPTYSASGKRDVLILICIAADTYVVGKALNAGTA